MRYWDEVAWSEPHLLPPDAEPFGATDNRSPFQQAPTARPSRPRQEADGATAQFRPSSAPAGPAVDSPSRSTGTAKHVVAGTSASFPKRLAARFLDALIQWALYLILLLPSDTVSVGHEGFYVQFPGWSTASAIWAIIAGILVFWVWEFVWVSQRSATPGKMLLGLLVAERMTDPRPGASESQQAVTVPPSPQAAALRIMPRVFYGVPVAGLFVWIAETLAGLYFIFKGGDHRLTLGDQISSTKVVADESVRHPNRPLAAGLVAGALCVGLVTGGLWYFLHRPALAEAAAVLDDITDDNLAEATSAFASSCDVDRLRYADYFTRNQMLDFTLDRVRIDWAVPLFSETGERTQAVVTGQAVVSGEVDGRQRVNLLLVREDGWQVCRFLND